ncbi:60S ribosomal protein L18a-1 [Acorus calamus]|uniref:60S ribosomal protein L18a-1 n=1 Tax=Acorus calamus TaxID=4465 RepID=A0AAV9DEG3_ACOCL|nr:60S ribosomal protein L18a-1 [Acorus calamus]
MTQQRGDPSNPPIAVNQYGTFPSAPPFQQQNIPQSPYCPHHAIPVGYQSYPTVVVEGVPLREPPLPLCGIGIGWALFVFGFFFAAVPWYVGAFILLFVTVDHREKAGLVACTVAAILMAITIIFGTSKGNIAW